MHHDGYWTVSSVIDDDELTLAKIRQLRPNSDASQIDWPSIEEELKLAFSDTDRRDLREALVCLAACVRRREFEADDGRQIDAQLNAVITRAAELAECLRKLEQDVAEIVKSVAGDPKSLAEELSKYSGSVRVLTAPKRNPGRPPMQAEEDFAYRIEGVWRRAAGTTKRGANYDAYTEKVVGPAVKLAAALLACADLGQCLPKVGDVLRRTVPKKAADERAEVVEGRVVAWRTAQGETATLLVEGVGARSPEDPERGK